MSKLSEILNSPDATLRWREIRDEIHAESDRATTPQQFDALHAVFKAIMDTAEQSVPAEHLERFRKARDQDYKILIVREALVGQNVCVETLHAVTEREISAGRMAPDHPLRRIAETGTFAPHFSRAELELGAAETAQNERQSTRWWQFWK